MGRLRLVHSDANPSAQAESGCLDAFQHELDYLYMTLHGWAPAPGKIDDLLQEVFLVLYRHWPGLDVTRSLRPWLFGVTFRVLRAHRRRRAREVLCAEFELEDATASPESLLQDRESLVTPVRGAGPGSSRAPVGRGAPQSRGGRHRRHRASPVDDEDRRLHAPLQGPSRAGVGAPADAAEGGGQMTRADAPLDPELESLVRPPKVARQAPPELRARALVRASAIVGQAA